MKRCPNTAIKTCKVRTHADDALYCHLCGAKLVESIEDTTNHVDHSKMIKWIVDHSNKMIKWIVDHSNKMIKWIVDHSKMIKWIIAIMVIIGVIALIITFWQQIVLFIGVVFVIIIILAVLGSSN